MHRDRAWNTVYEDTKQCYAVYTSEGDIVQCDMNTIRGKWFRREWKWKCDNRKIYPRYIQNVKDI